jgi:hypothetical protein
MAAGAPAASMVIMSGGFGSHEDALAPVAGGEIHSDAGSWCPGGVLAL